MQRLSRFISVILILLMLIGICEAVVRNGSIRGKTGLSYGPITYSRTSANVVIRNSTKYNVNFGGSMLFLDKNYRVLARAELMTAKIKRRSSRTFRAAFIEGTGEEAKKARYVEWEF